jgi:hypothetical protein
LPIGCADPAADTLMGVKFDKSYSREARRHWPGVHRKRQLSADDVAGIYRSEQFSRDRFLLCLSQPRFQISGSVVFSARRSI